jgi:hypothetical protein
VLVIKLLNALLLIFHQIDFFNLPPRSEEQSEFSEPSDRVFCDQEDVGPIKDLDHWMKWMCKAAGVTRVGFKGIRHLVAVELYRAGHPVAEKFSAGIDNHGTLLTVPGTGGWDVSGDRHIGGFGKR